jgi:hypothetical protein
MAVGVYGTVRPSDVTIDDISIYYNYTPNRETVSNTIYSLNASELISYNYLPDSEQISNTENILEGLYNLRLPSSVFNQLGIYTIYVKPKSIPLVILDCGVLSALPNIKGILIDINSIPEKLRYNNSLQGYRIEYINSDGTKLRNVIRHIVTSNKVVPVGENVGNTTQKTIRYRFDDSGTLLFLQLTPSSSSDVKPNMLPFIGNVGQTIILSNTYFNPLTIEVEMVENTIDTLMDVVAGEQVKDVRNGIQSFYDKNRVITKQFDLFEIKDDVTDVPLFEVRQKRTTIDESQNFDNVVEGL